MNPWLFIFAVTLVFIGEVIDEATKIQNNSIQKQPPLVLSILYLIIINQSLHLLTIKFNNRPNDINIAITEKTTAKIDRSIY